MSEAVASQSVFRVDKFVVPTAARSEFAGRLGIIQGLLGGLDGCLQNLVLENPRNGETTTFVTIVEWQSEASMAKAREAVAAEYAMTGFDPQDFMRQLGVSGDLGTYWPVSRATG